MVANSDAGTTKSAHSGDEATASHGDATAGDARATAAGMSGSPAARRSKARHGNRKTESDPEVGDDVISRGAEGLRRQMSDSEAQQDATLVRKAREGDRDAFGILVRRYQVQAVMMAQTVLKNMELSKDASQNAFVKAYVGLKNFREDSQFKTWLFRIVLNEAKTTYRKEKSRGWFRRVTGRDDDESREASILEAVPSKERSPRDVSEVEEMKSRLGEALETLPERERHVFMLRYLNELSVAEVAEILGIAAGTVKAHASHAQEKLKFMLATPVKSESFPGGV